MDWTDKHCRYLHRLLTRDALLFTEMITSSAIIHGDHQRLLGYNDEEHPVALQLGGSDPAELAEATRIGAAFGYDEINLNVGCPSDRVKSGRFGACLMAHPELVADCVKAMKQATDVPISVKCRIGIDDQDIEEPLDRFVDAVIAAGASSLYVHARKAWLSGLSPKDNRTIPPLDYDRVYRLAARLAPFPVSINGGIETLPDAEEHLKHVSGVMLGRAAYYNPMLMVDVDRKLYGSTGKPVELGDVIEKMTDYAEAAMSGGARLNHVTRHMLGLACGRPGARRFRQILSVGVSQPGAGPEIIAEAYSALTRHLEPVA